MAFSIYKSISISHTYLRTPCFLPSSRILKLYVWVIIPFVRYCTERWSVQEEYVGREAVLYTDRVHKRDKTVSKYKIG